ncbi:hypothetical protein AB0G74_11505 [Streptomyces sp. NPDC020875]|uniref:hypothetical protein n=1 Tax=Streptomyces sp. NPDC020875 TaxID=3154898 RepID=UPI00340ACA1E
MPVVDSPARESQLDALIAAGGYWGLAPDWVPRAGYVRDRDTLIRALAALRRLVQNETARLRRRRTCAY